MVYTSRICIPPMKRSFKGLKAKTILILLLSVSLIGSLTAQTVNIRVSVYGADDNAIDDADGLIDPIYIQYLRNLPGVTAVPVGESCDFTILVNALKVAIKDHQLGYTWASVVVDKNGVLVRGTNLYTSEPDMRSVQQIISREIMKLEPKVFGPFRIALRKTSNN